MKDSAIARLPEASTQGEDDARDVSATLAGDLGAFDRLIERYQRRAVSVAYRLLGSVHDATDVCQEAFLRAYRSLGTLEEPARFAAWLIRIVSNLSLNYRRGRRVHLSLAADDGDETRSSDGAARSPGRIGERLTASDDDDPRHAALSAELERRISQAVEALPEKQRLALVLFAIEDLPQKEVADILQMSVETVKWNVFQARKTLKEELAEYLTE